MHTRLLQTNAISLSSLLRPLLFVASYVPLSAVPYARAVPFRAMRDDPVDADEFAPLAQQPEWCDVTPLPSVRAFHCQRSSASAALAAPPPTRAARARAAAGGARRRRVPARPANGAVDGARRGALLLRCCRRSRPRAHARARAITPSGSARLFPRRARLRRGVAARARAHCTAHRTQPCRLHRLGLALPLRGIGRCGGGGGRGKRRRGGSAGQRRCVSAAGGDAARCV